MQLIRMKNYVWLLRRDVSVSRSEDTTVETLIGSSPKLNQVALARDRAYLYTALVYVWSFVNLKLCACINDHSLKSLLWLYVVQTYLCEVWTDFCKFRMSLVNKCTSKDVFMINQYCDINKLQLYDSTW